MMSMWCSWKFKSLSIKWELFFQNRFGKEFWKWVVKTKDLGLCGTCYGFESWFSHHLFIGCVEVLLLDLVWFLKHHILHHDGNVCREIWKGKWSKDFRGNNWVMTSCTYKGYCATGVVGGEVRLRSRGGGFF